MANHRNMHSKSLLTHQQGKETSAYEFENPHLSRYEWLHTPAQPKEWCFEFNRTLYPPDYQDDRQHHHASYGDLTDPQNCVLVNFSGVKGFLPSDMRKDTYGDLQGSPEPFPTRETPDKHLGPPKCLPDGN